MITSVVVTDWIGCIAPYAKKKYIVHRGSPTLSRCTRPPASRQSTASVGDPCLARSIPTLDTQTAQTSNDHGSRQITTLHTRRSRHLGRLGGREEVDWLCVSALLCPPSSRHASGPSCGAASNIRAASSSHCRRPATNLIPDSSIKSIADGYFGVGETVYNIVSSQVVTSSYFKRT